MTAAGFFTPSSASGDGGGALEHPAGSNAFRAYELGRPEFGRWTLHRGLWLTEVWQSAYGHKARKRTWLAYSSLRGNAPLPGIWAKRAGTHQCGWFDRIKPTLSKAEASRTPPAFAAWLISLAQQARPAPATPEQTGKVRR